MKPRPEESIIVEHWNFNGRNMTRDKNGERIDWLIHQYLKKVGVDESGWIVLYQDMEDNRYWEIGYPHGEMQGGGPKTLTVLPEQEARLKYNL